jgi:DNA ligase-associated metallophosphoesterase
LSPAYPFQLQSQQCWLSAERCLYWEDERTLIISDLHFGKTGHFRKSGIAVPQDVYKEDLHRLMQQVQYFQPDKIIFTGDLFHSYENQEHALFAKWRKSISSNSIHLVKGNHDLLSNKVYTELGLEVHENRYEAGPFTFVHDLDSITGGTENGYSISGHIHPGVRISGQGKQSLSFPCFYFSENHAILPAFSKFTGFVLIEPLKSDAVFAIVKGNLQKGENPVLVKIQ